MALYVEVSDVCLADADRHSQTSLVKNLARRIEETQSLTGFDHFLPTRLLKKGLGRSYRLIAYRASVAEDELILFLCVLARGSNEYKYFLESWDKKPEEVTRRFQTFSDNELGIIHARLTSVSPPPPLPPPDGEETAWLHEVLQESAREEDLLVLETETWVRKMRAPVNRDFMALYHQVLEHIGLDLDKLRPASTNTACQIYWEKNLKLGVAYLYRPDLQRLVLLEPLRHTDNSEPLLDEHRQRLSKIKEGLHDYSRIAARSYPFLMVLDRDAWLAIQKDEEANLALSPEEAELLESVHRAKAAGELGYPLFINGRAGSGKSTMLQYLAARYVAFALRKNTSQLPLYMTCSPDLLERARQTVRGLLTAHHDRLLEKPHDPAALESVLQRCFGVFHDFLYSLLPVDVQKALSRDRYVNYATFRKLWSEQFARRPEARRTSPDLAWHTIRSFIKGIRSGRDDELGPEEYNALPRRRRSVSEDTFRQVYERVWCSWYKRLCEDEGYWDDQDLAACVLEAGAASGIDCPAIFCDEAQDFTPAELDIIYQLSLFGRRSLQPEELRRVPIVFAGDPLQTINPTGFRWDAVQSDFHERFCAVLDPRRRTKLDISYRELRFNYRSNPGIVNFCNLIQLARAALLSVRSIQPQEAWWVDAPVQTVWFVADNALTEQQLLQRPELVKLVNCEEGEETEYVRADSLLKNLSEEADGIYRNVLGPTRAKGLEFPAVVLYRFGETAPSGVSELLLRRAPLETREQRLPFEYFFNRLYVAASRAKGQLVVVDSERALQDFWRFAGDPELVEGLMSHAGNGDLWRDSVTFLVPGTERAWSGEKINPREQAAEYSGQGHRKRDPYLLRQAALAYRSGGDALEAGKCLAYALELEGKVREAGERYQEIDLYDEAFRCFWEGRHWRALCDLAAQRVELMPRLEARAADFMLRGSGLPIEFLRGFVAACSDDGWTQCTVRDRPWIAVIMELGERLTKASADQALPWHDLYGAFEMVTAAGLATKDEHVAAIAFGAGDYVSAVRLWDRSGAKRGNEYRRAKARIEPFPRNLDWLGQLNEYNEILREWREHSGEIVIAELEEAAVHAVAEAAMDRGDLNLAVNVLMLKPSSRQLGKLLKAGLDSGDAGVITLAAVMAARLFVREGKWGPAVRAAEESSFAELKIDGAVDFRPALGQKGAVKVISAVVRELAVSSALSDASAGRRGRSGD